MLCATGADADIQLNYLLKMYFKNLNFDVNGVCYGKDNVFNINHKKSAEYYKKYFS